MPPIGLAMLRALGLTIISLAAFCSLLLPHVGLITFAAGVGAVALLICRWRQ